MWASRVGIGSKQTGLYTRSVSPFKNVHEAPVELLIVPPKQTRTQSSRSMKIIKFANLKPQTVYIYGKAICLRSFHAVLGVSA